VAGGSGFDGFDAAVIPGLREEVDVVQHNEAVSVVSLAESRGVPVDGSWRPEKLQ